MLQILSEIPGQCPVPLVSTERKARQRRNGLLHLAPRSPIFLEGLGQGPHYRLVEGCVALSQSLPDGRRQIIDILGPGRLLGIGMGERNRCSADTLSYATLEPVVARDHAEIERDLLDMVMRAQAHAMLLGRKTVLERVATAILDLAGQFVRPVKNGKRNAVCFHLHPTRADLADWLGLTVETVSRSFSRLKKAGLIDFTHPEIVTLLQPQTLSEIAAGRRELAVS